MLDAELAEGDLNQVTQAIQNALRPNPGIQRIVAPPAMNGGQTTHVEDVQAVVDEQEISDDAEKPIARQRVSKSRKYPSPDVIDVDLKSPPSFADYIATKKIESDVQRFLTVAAWFKECRQIDEITADHVYTCYRAAHWPYDIGDFAQPLRNLKFKKLMTSPSRGVFSINHIGLAQVAALENG